MTLESHDVTADDGTRLRVWEDAPEEQTETDEAVLFVHGAITNSRALFAPPVEGDDGEPDDSYSWLRATAEAGRTAYALDVRGYGESEFPQAMAEPPEDDDPPVRAEDAAGDVAAAFDFVADRHPTVHLVGVSWGTMTTGRFLADREAGGETGEDEAAEVASDASDAAADATEVASYVQCAPVYDPAYDFEEGVSALGLDPDLDAYFVDDRETVAERQDAEENPALFEAVWRAMAESGQGEAADREDAYVAQTGALADVKACCDGDPPYDPADIAVPTLVVRGSDDDTSGRSDALTLYDELGSADDRKEYAELAGADHYAMHGDRRRTLYEIASAFHDRNA